MSNTQGPWKIVDWSPGHEQSDGSLIIGPNDSIVCMPMVFDDDSDGFIFHSDADAMLICASPDLLEAAQDIIEWIDDDERMSRYLPEFEALRNAVNKATGQTNE